MSRKKKISLSPERENIRKSLIPYFEARIDREKKFKKEVLASGEKYHGLLPMYEDHLKRLKDGTYWGYPNVKLEPSVEEKRKEAEEAGQILRATQAKIHPISKTNNDIVVNQQTFEREIRNEEVEELVKKLHEAKIGWAESLDDEEQKKSWLSFYERISTQNEYWALLGRAAQRSWVLEMNGLLPHQNGIAPSQEECRQIWEKNYGRDE